MNAHLPPDETVFRAHLTGGRFQSGAASGRWRFVSVSWPNALFGVRAADGSEYGLLFNCVDYPRTPATARLWDIEQNCPLSVAKWPKGQDRVPLAFNPNWKDGSCLYLPCDRISIEGHENWHQLHPSLIWNPTLGIVHYLRVVYDLLNSGDYGGRLGA